MPPEIGGLAETRRVRLSTFAGVMGLFTQEIPTFRGMSRQANEWLTFVLTAANRGQIPDYVEVEHQHAQKRGLMFYEELSDAAVKKLAHRDTSPIHKPMIVGVIEYCETQIYLLCKPKTNG